MKRLGHAILLLIGVSLLTFAFTALTPGNYFDEMRLNPQISPETVTALRAQYGLTQSMPRRYTHWLGAIAHGDFGFSFAYNGPAAPLLWARVGNTLLLTVPAMIITWTLALILGVWSADHCGGVPDHAVSSFTGILLIVPDLVIALGLLLLAVRTGWFPTGGMTSVGFDEFSWSSKLSDLAKHIALPLSALILSNLPTLVRHVRASTAEVLGSGFMRAAQAHGISHRVLLYRYALRAAANPLISLFGFSVGALLSGSLLIEVVMSWPGLGPLLLESILARDIYLVVGSVLFSTVFLVAGIFLSDLLLYWADPRIRTHEAYAIHADLFDRKLTNRSGALTKEFSGKSE